MASGIKDKVAILGMGCAKFGERWDCNADDLIVEAYSEASWMPCSRLRSCTTAFWFGSTFSNARGRTVTRGGSLKSSPPRPAADKSRLVSPPPRCWEPRRGLT